MIHTWSLKVGDITFEIPTCSAKRSAWYFGKMLFTPTPTKICSLLPTKTYPKSLTKAISFSGLTFGDSAGWKPWFTWSRRLMRGRAFCPTSLWALRALALFQHPRGCASGFGIPYRAGSKQAQLQKQYWSISHRNCWSRWIILIDCFKSSWAVSYTSGASDCCARYSFIKKHKLCLWTL